MVYSPQMFLLGFCESCREVNERVDILNAAFPPVTATLAGAHWRVNPPGGAERHYQLMNFLTT